MIGQSAFAAKGATAIRAGVLLLARFPPRHRRCSRHRLEDIVSREVRESIIILSLT